MEKQPNFILSAILVVVALGFGLLLLQRNIQKNPLQVVCTMEAKICPDGSAVGRTGPKCEFAECPKGPVVKKETGTLTGQVTLSPTCPVERVPPDPACAPRPYPALVDVSGANNFILEVHANTDGVFLMKLPLGLYQISIRQGSLYPRCDSKNVSITVNSTTTANISCDSGIR